MPRKKNIPRKLKPNDNTPKKTTQPIQPQKKGKNKLWIGVLTIVAVAIALFLILPDLNTGRKKTITHAPVENNAFYTQIIHKRKVFQDYFYNPQEFLSDYENDKYFLKIANNKSTEIKISQPEIFFSKEKIINEIGINDNITDSEKLSKIHDFAQKNTKHMKPLYESTEQHEPVYFYNVYGCGFCDDAAQNFALLAQFFNFKSQIHWLSGHVVSSIYHDSAWRVYDPDALGIVRTNGNVATYDEMVSLAHQNTFNQVYNKVYKTIEDNRVSAPLVRKENTSPEIDFLQNEQRLFFKQLYMISTDGHYLSGLKSSDEFFMRYENIVANFIKEIPVEELRGQNNSLILTDYFPLCGIFIAVPKEEGNIAINDIAIELQTDFKPKNATVQPPPEKFKVGASRINSDALKFQYFNLSLGVKNLENRPSHTIKLLNIDYLKTIKGAKLLLVHYYCVANSDFSKENLENLQENGLQVNLN